MYDPMKDETIDPAWLAANKGYSPQQAVEVQTLMGDTSDNVPGVKGIGPKTAAKLIAQYGTAEAVLAHADELSPKLRESVRAFAPQLALTRQLVTLQRDAAIQGELESFRWHGIDGAALLPIFRELDFRRLIEPMEKLAAEGLRPAAGPSAATAAAPAGPASAPPSPANQKPHFAADLFAPAEPPPAPAPAAQDSIAPAPAPPAAAASAPPAPPQACAADFDYRLVDTVEGLKSLIAQMAGVKKLAVDTETTDKRPIWAELVGVSLSWESGKAFYVPVRAPMGCPVVPMETFREWLGPILADPKIKKVGHNIKYDLIVLKRAGMELAGIDFDTYLGSWVLDAAADGRLDAVAARRLNHRCIPISDLIGSGAKKVTIDCVATRAVAVYSGEDADLSLRLAELLEPLLAAEGLAELFRQVELPLVTVLADMQLAGIRVDPQELKRQEQAMAVEADRLRERIMLLAGGPFNPDSPIQLAEVLFDRLKLPQVRKIKTGQSTDAAVLEALTIYHELPAVVLEYRQLTKLLGTYLRTLAEHIHPQTGRVHASFNQAGTITGRLSSSEPNLQNIPIRSAVGRAIRSAFVAERGFKLLSADYNQVELRVLAHFCQDRTLMETFAAGRDIHRIVAGEVFGVPADEVTAEQRARAKTVNFGIIYGQTAHGLAQVLRIGRTEAQDFISRHRRRFPAIDAFLHECVEQARRAGYVETILKRRRPIPDISSRNPSRRAAAERMAINSVVQGSAADLIKRAMIAIHGRLAAENRPSRLLLQIHDELVFEIPEGAVEPERQMIISEMESAIPLSVPLRVDTGVGDNWMAAK
jgi:DNA polymerase-1